MMMVMVMIIDHPGKHVMPGQFSGDFELISSDRSSLRDDWLIYIYLSMYPCIALQCFGNTFVLAPTGALYVMICNYISSSHFFESLSSHAFIVFSFHRVTRVSPITLSATSATYVTSPTSAAWAISAH